MSELMALLGKEDSENMEIEIKKEMAEIIESTDLEQMITQDIKTEDDFLDDGETCVETVEVTETSGEEDPLFSAKEATINHKQEKHERLKFPCNQCEYKADTLTDLIKHVKSNHARRNGKKYPCDQCDYKANRPGDLRKHTQAKHEGVRYFCNKCDFSTGFISALHYHTRSKHEKIKYPCDQCDYLARRPSDLTKHKEKKHEGIRYPCDQCEYLAADKETWRKHRKTKHGDLRYPCDECEFTASDQSDLEWHIQSQHLETDSPASDKLSGSEHDLELYFCNGCNFVTIEAQNLKTHKETIHGVASVPGILDDTVTTQSILKIHEDNNVTPPEQTEGRTCVVKEELGDNPFNLLTDIKTEDIDVPENTGAEEIVENYIEEDQLTFVKDVKMEENSEFFALPVEITENSLGDKKVIAKDVKNGDFNEDHIVLENEEVYMKTEEGTESFLVVDPLSVPKEVRRYPCDLCDFTATTGFNLKRHKESQHEGIRYPCDQCDYKATQPLLLKKHKWKHFKNGTSTDLSDVFQEDPVRKRNFAESMNVRFPCNQCGFSATTGFNLKRHIESQHEGIRYPCDQCDYKATQPLLLKKHKMRRHLKNLKTPASKDPGQKEMLDENATEVDMQKESSIKE